MDHGCLRGNADAMADEAMDPSPASGAPRPSVFRGKGEPQDDPAGRGCFCSSAHAAPSVVVLQWLGRAGEGSRSSGRPAVGRETGTQQSVGYNSNSVATRLARLSGVTSSLSGVARACSGLPSPHGRAASRQGRCSDPSHLSNDGAPPPRRGPGWQPANRLRDRQTSPPSPTDEQQQEKKQEPPRSDRPQRNERNRVYKRMVLSKKADGSAEGDGEGEGRSLTGVQAVCVSLGYHHSAPIGRATRSARRPLRYPPRCSPASPVRPCRPKYPARAYAGEAEPTASRSATSLAPEEKRSRYHTTRNPREVNPGGKVPGAQANHRTAPKPTVIAHRHSKRWWGGGG